MLPASLLALPPTLRASIYRSTTTTTTSAAASFSRRAFSATTIRRLNLTDAIVAGPTVVLDGIHSIGIPWCAAIPIAAVLVRGTLGYYVAALPARKRAIVRRMIFPLSTARAKFREADYKREMLNWSRERKENSWAPHRAIGFFARALMPNLVAIQESHRTGKAFGAPLFSFRGFINFAALIAFVEALRVKCGSSEGLLSLILSPFARGERGSNVAKDDLVAMDPGELLARRIEAAQAARQARLDTAAQQSGLGPDAAGSQESVAQVASLPKEHLMPLEPKAYAEFLDPSMQTEGFAWMQDLTVPDATFSLPLALATVMVARILLRPRTEKIAWSIPPGTSDPTEAASNAEKPATVSASGDISSDMTAALAAANKISQEAANQKGGNSRKKPKSKGSLTVMQRIGLTVSGLFFMVSLKLPAAMLLYIIPTILTGWLQTRWLDIKYPLPNYITPCKRPLRVKVRQQFSNV